MNPATVLEVMLGSVSLTMLLRVCKLWARPPSLDSFSPVSATCYKHRQQTSILI